MSRFLAPAALAAALLTGSAGAEENKAPAFTAGNKLFTWCTGTDTDMAAKSLCLGYIEGIADALSGAQSMNGSLGGWRACIPVPVTPGQVQDIATLFLREHPESRHYSAASLVARALSEAFPCPPAARP